MQLSEGDQHFTRATCEGLGGLHSLVGLPHVWQGKEISVEVMFMISEAYNRPHHFPLAKYDAYDVSGPQTKKQARPGCNTWRTQRL